VKAQLINVRDIFVHIETFLRIKVALHLQKDYFKGKP